MLKKILFTLFVLGSLVCQAQDYYLANARKRLSEGDCEKASKSYEMYLKQGGKSVSEIESKIEECKRNQQGTTEDGSDVEELNQQGLSYFYGSGVSRSYAEAVKFFQLAAYRNCAKAQNNLGYCYENGLGVSQSYYEAEKWYRKAAEQGDANAQNSLGEYYYHGKGGTKSYAEAVKWYKKAAEQGNASAQFSLGFCYESGYGVTASSEEAVKWYRMASARGDRYARQALDRLGEY